MKIRGITTCLLLPSSRGVGVAAIVLPFSCSVTDDKEQASDQILRGETSVKHRMSGEKWEQLGADITIAVVHQIRWSEQGRRWMKQPTASTTATSIAHPILVATCFLLVAITLSVFVLDHVLFNPRS